MRFIGSATVALVVLSCADELFNGERFTRAAIVMLRNVVAAIGIHF
jgi:hypothetical protein